MDGYNGWANYPTWVASLWLENEERTYRVVQDYVEKITPFSRIDPDSARLMLAHFLETLMEDSYPDLRACLYSDLLGWAWEKIDWYEIADAYLEGE